MIPEPPWEIGSGIAACCSEEWRSSRSALAALSSSSLMLALSRALQGVGAACITPLTLTILTRTFPENQRGLVIGLWSGIAGLGLTITRAEQRRGFSMPYP